MKNEEFATATVRSRMFKVQCSMFNVLISLGSNYQQSAHIQWASQRLSMLLSSVAMSRCLWTMDIHGRGVWYMNRLVRGTTPLSPDELNSVLKQIEQATGRTPQRVTIDLDLMQYDNERYHLSDWQRPYIQDLLDF